MQKVYINNVQIPQNDIVSISNNSESLSHQGDTLAGAQVVITLDNTEYAYDERVKGGLFYDNDWYNSEVSVFDTEIDQTIFTGKIKKYAVDDAKRQVTITVNDYIVDMCNVVCTSAEVEKTPAEIIYSILTDPNQMGLDEERIVKGSFDAAATYQNALGIKITTNYTLADNIKVIDAIRTLCEYTAASLYVKDNKIVYYQRKPYSGELGRNIYDSDVIAASVKQVSDDKNIYNAYSIAYVSGSSVLRATGADTYSKLKYGVTNTFVCPKSGTNSSSIADYKVLFTTSTAATAVGNLILQLFSRRRTEIQLTLPLDFADVWLGDILMLHCKPYHNEPVLVTEINKNPQQRTMSIKCELINYYKTVVLDNTPPLTPELLGYVYNYNKNELYIECVADKTTVALMLFISDIKDFNKTYIINNNVSPLRIQSYKYGGRSFVWTSLPPGNYYVKLQAVDASNNRSEASDVLYISIPSDVTPPSRRFYRTSGGLCRDYLLVDKYNQSNDSPPETLLSYDDYPKYGIARYEVACVYDSDTLYFSYPFAVEANPVTTIQLRTYNNEWSIFGNKIELPAEIPAGIHQLRVNITPRTWAEVLQYHFRIL